MKKTICLITASRSDYGPLAPLIKEMQHSNKIILNVVATGSHVSKFHGQTKFLLKNDKIKIHKEISTLSKSDSTKGITDCIAVGTKIFTQYFKKSKPDAVIILGDRFDILGPAFAAYFSFIPIIHLYGGEVTEGAFDDSIRHCITKLAHFHFVANNRYKNRVIQMGEYFKNVYVCGSLGIDKIKNKKQFTKAELTKRLKIKWNRYNILVTYHPTTHNPGRAKYEFTEIIKSLAELKDTNFIFTAPNADTEATIIRKLIQDFKKDRNEQVFFFEALGNDYTSVCKHVDLVVGNSSSGLIEVPMLKTVTINIGNRQKGRERGDSVIDCPVNSSEITSTCKKYLKSSEVKKLKFTNPYYKKNSAKFICSIIEKINLDKIKNKSFHDIETMNSNLTSNKI